MPLYIILQYELYVLYRIKVQAFRQLYYQWDSYYIEGGSYSSSSIYQSVILLEDCRRRSRYVIIELLYEKEKVLLILLSRDTALFLFLKVTQYLLRAYKYVYNIYLCSLRRRRLQVSYNSILQIVIYYFYKRLFVA